MVQMINPRMAPGEKRDASIMLDSLMGLFNVSRAKDPFVSCPRAGCGCQHFSLGIILVKIDQVEQPLKCNSVGAENVSHRRTPPCHDHLDHGVIVLEEVKQMRCVAGLAVRRNKNRSPV